jgi:hypothetical protein
VVEYAFTGEVFRPIGLFFPVSGDFTLAVPPSRPLPIPCAKSFEYVTTCGGLLPPGTYKIAARLYLQSNPGDPGRSLVRSKTALVAAAGSGTFRVLESH